MHSVLLRCLVPVFLLVFHLAGHASDAEPSSPAPDQATESWEGRVVILPVKTEIDWDRSALVKSALEEAFDRIRRESPRLVVLEVDSPGGRVDICDYLSEKLVATNVPTVALVLRKAVSGGAIIATACNEIIMVKGSRIGDVKPILLFPGPLPVPAKIDDGIMKKIEAEVITLLESNATANNHPTKLLQAMVSLDIELYQVTFEDDSREFLTAKEVEVLEENISKERDKRKIQDKKVVCEKGRLLHLTDQAAVDYGLAKSIVESRDAFFVARGIDSSDVVIAEVSTGKLEITEFFDVGLEASTVILLGLFLMIGIAGAVTEVFSPGFGVPGAIGIIGFTCFFYMLAMEDHAEWYEILLFVMGVAFLVMEIVVIPGFGVPGILGILFLGAGLFLSFMPDLGDASGQVIWQQASAFVLMLFCVIVGSSAFVYGLIQYGHRVPVLRSLYHSTTLRSGKEELAAVEASTNDEAIEASHNPLADLVGVKGVALTPLRPSGKMRTGDGRKLDVVTEGGLIEKDAAVIVLETRMNRIVVGLDSSVETA